MSNIKFKYFGDTSKAYTNVITVASELLHDKENNNYIVKFGYSFSNRKDRYNKKIGSNIATNRLLQNPESINLDEFLKENNLNKPTYKIINSLLFDYITNKSKIIWVREMYEEAHLFDYMLG